jgi:hypothetical protein
MIVFLFSRNLHLIFKLEFHVSKKIAIADILY